MHILFLKTLHLPGFLKAKQGSYYLIVTKNYMDLGTRDNCSKVRDLIPNQLNINAMKFELYSTVALAEDLPEKKLKKGDLVTIVEHLPASKAHAEGYVVEVSDVLGNTICVATLFEGQLQKLVPNAIPSMRIPVAA